jgi:hypothetical protein
LPPQNVGGHYASRGVAHLFRREGLGQIIDGTKSHGLDGGLEGGERCDHDDADSRLTTQDFWKDAQS